MNKKLDEEYSLKNIFLSLNYKEELVYGSLAGFTICLVGHPFDTIKTYSQVFNKNFLFSVKSIYSHGGLFNFYKGICSPLTTATLLNAGVFTAYEVSRKILAHTFNVGSNDYSVIAASGFLTGTLNSFLCAPIELLKIQKQIQVDKAKVSSYNQILGDIRRNSGFRGLFLGTYLTIGRDSIGYLFQFLSYHMVLDSLAKNAETVDNVNWHHLLAGAVAGFTCWVVGYPFDTVKSIYQGGTFNKPISVRSSGEFRQICSVIYQRAGVRGFYLGLGSIMGRAILGNAVGFYVWNISRKFIKLEKTIPL